MKNNIKLKIYLCITVLSILMFGIAFAFGWFYFESMVQVYAATLPFIFTAGAALAVFAMTPEQKCHITARGNMQAKIIHIGKINKTNCIIYGNLRKIS